MQDAEVGWSALDIVGTSPNVATSGETHKNQECIVSSRVGIESGHPRYLIPKTAGAMK